ncbi:ABC transporter permease [Sporosarcina sp. USHLN248]|uniref:YhgE/Pip domain-containing protein n=1 Tax=Sporosarcina sp. USHLN248 TaxID=3081300 RepID=UPI003019AC9D
MAGLKALFKLRGTYLGIIAAVMFQIIFFSIWLTAYKGVQDRTDSLTIGIVNEDEEIGEQMIHELEQSLPFQVKQFNSLQIAQKEMNDRTIEMVIQIPSDFSSSIIAAEQPSIIYWINQATATFSKTMMETASLHITDEVNTTLYGMQTQSTISVFNEQLGQLPLDEKVAQAIGESVQMAVGSLHPNIVEEKINKTNAVDDFSANLVPLMVIISSFAGAMVMIMQINEASHSIKQMHSKWSLFIGMQLINIGVAFILPFLTIGLMYLFGIEIQEPLIVVYLFQAIMFLSFLCFAQLFVVLLGNVGMLFNILLLSLQLVTSGVLVSTKLLPNAYSKLSTILPATYGADGYYSIVFGGRDGILMENIGILLMITAIALLISVVAIAARKEVQEDRLQ